MNTIPGYGFPIKLKPLAPVGAAVVVIGISIAPLLGTPVKTPSKFWAVVVKLFGARTE